jgi:anti-sigma factor RsiW
LIRAVVLVMRPSILPSVSSEVLTCRRFVEFLDDYLAGALPEGERSSFAGHLAACPSCVAYMKTYAASVRLAKRALQHSEAPVPEEVPAELVRAVLAASKNPS